MGKRACYRHRAPDWRTFSMVTGSPRPGTRCSRPPASPARPTTRWSRCCSRWTPASCGTARTSWPGCSPTAASPTTTRARNGRAHSTSSRGSSTPPSGTSSPAGVRQRVRASRRSSPTSTAPGRAFDDGVVPWQPRLHQREVPPRGGRDHPAQRRPGARRRHRPHPRRAGQVPGPRGQRAGPVRGQLRAGEPAGDDQDCSPRCSPTRRSTRSTSTRPGCSPRCGRPRRTASSTRSSWCSPPACTTPPTSSTPCSPG